MFLNDHRPMGQPAGCNGPRPANGSAPPEGLAQASTAQLIECLLSECGAYGMAAADALILGARIGGATGYQEVPVAAWSRYRARRQDEAEQAEFFRRADEKRGGI